MAAEETPLIGEWYPELIYGISSEPSETEKSQALEAVRLAMGGIEEAMRRGLIEDVQLSFEIPANHAKALLFPREKTAFNMQCRSKYYARRVFQALGALIALSGFAKSVAKIMLALLT